MDSFSRLSKLEIINQPLDSVNCGIPFLYGLFSSFVQINEENHLEFTTDIKPLFEFILKTVKNIIKNYKKVQNGKTNEFFDKILLDNNVDKYIELKESFLKINEKVFYRIIFKSIILQELFSLYNIEESNSFLENVKTVSKNTDSLRAFIKGVYIGCATSSIKISISPSQKTSCGYHLEFSSKNLVLLRELSHILAQFDISAKLITRKSNYVLYIKDAENVSDLLALVGANNSVITLQNEIVKREFRNKINRQTNCVSGNISKTVEASINQLNAIEKIDATIGLNSLPPDLEEVALMRIANPEEPLTTLLKLSDMKLTKSGLNHRLRKIISIADKLN